MRNPIKKSSTAVIYAFMAAVMSASGMNFGDADRVFSAEVRYEIDLPNAPDAVIYDVSLLEQPADDPVALCNYLIVSKGGSANDADRNFSAYFDGHFYRFRNDRLTEMHRSENSVPFNNGIQNNELFTNLLPAYIYDYLEKAAADSTFIFNINEQNDVTVVNGAEHAGGYEIKRFSYKFDKYSRPLSSEVTVSPGLTTEQTMTATYAYASEPDTVRLSQERLKELFPDEFRLFGKDNFSLSSLKGRLLPALSLRDVAGGRYTHHRGDAPGKPTVFVALDEADQSSGEYIDMTRRALSPAPTEANVVYVFAGHDIEHINDITGDVQKNERVLYSGRSFMKDCGMDSLPCVMVIDSCGIIKETASALNYDYFESVINLLNSLNMETVYFKSTPVEVYGMVPVVGSVAPDFHLTSNSLTDITRSDFPGKRIVLNIFPSLDTDVCAASVRRFNQEATKLDNVVVLCVSMDLPFAMSRFCTINGIENVVPASAFRSPEFAKEYGVMMVDGPLKGLLARTVVVLDEDGRVIYRELVEEITNEPDYEAAISVLKK